ncbi:MAG: NAD(P)/FAD-dependent oxidoreductase, partial [Bacillota bacterium]|nr:NAD(P)/FAD-dependent oxidoreductase [Bacillota bacterium]
EQKAADLPFRQLEVMSRLLQQLPLAISGTRGFREAMVTAGGISLREIDPRTMMSRLVYGLYAAGEVLNIDGDTGGFNLQAAFSTGYLAGESAAAQAAASVWPA